VHSAYKVGQVQFDNFVRERLVERTKPTEDAIYRNKLKIFSQPASKPQAIIICKEKQKQRPADTTDKCSPGAARLTSSIPGQTPTLSHAPTLPSPTDWGWIKTSGMYEPLWTTLSEASKICWELVSCNYKEGCVKKCNCKNTRLECTHCVLAMGGCCQN